MQPQRFLIAWLPAFGWMGVIFYLSAQPQPLGQTPAPALAYVAHFGEYAMLSFLLLWAQLLSGVWKGKLRVTLAVSFVASALFASSDEYHQSFVPGPRRFILRLAADCLGAAFALAVTGRWGQLVPIATSEISPNSSSC